VAMPPRPRGSRIWYTPNVLPEAKVTPRLPRDRAKQRMIASAAKLLPSALAKEA
jgi:hypothetical protein